MCAANRQENAGQVLWWATCADDQAELELYARRGVLGPTGSYENTTDGQRYVLYRETRSLFEAILEDLEAEGLVVRTGETRPGPDGKMQPVYVAAQYASRKS